MVNLLRNPILAGNKPQIVLVLRFDLQNKDFIIIFLDQHDIAISLIFHCVQDFVLLLDSVFVC